MQTGSTATSTTIATALSIIATAALIIPIGTAAAATAGTADVLSAATASVVTVRPERSIANVSTNGQVPGARVPASEYASDINTAKEGRMRGFDGHTAR
jgi:NAD(P)H-hydrate repair Nnr-like enzyme with NAD(P)H-hydrate dehydratase domain